MALEPLPQSKVNGIISNFRLIFKSGIQKMNQSAYRFIHISSGFIAHYNMYGFIETYGDALTLAKDIINHAEPNKWLNFSPSDRDYTYMKQKAQIYKAIYEMACDYVEKQEGIQIERTDFNQRSFSHWGARPIFPDATR